MIVFDTDPSLTSVNDDSSLTFVNDDSSLTFVNHLLKRKFLFWSENPRSVNIQVICFDKIIFKTILIKKKFQISKTIIFSKNEMIVLRKKNKK